MTMFCMSDLSGDRVAWEGVRVNAEWRDLKKVDDLPTEVGRPGGDRSLVSAIVGYSKILNANWKSDFL
jgi:hypothetical protein